ncbi:MAG: nucleotidyl transferase AbiEii/AbiGii toxin family protein [Desulfamplus sp.]|nr:nucleotidyl transferase AbiEii/AbiGii toxin family protein [Desulfamplus sp.]
MEKIAKTLTPAQRRELFEATAHEQGRTPIVIEKDFWVCWILKRLFSLSDLNSHIVFKGGTSLSKVFGLIERFSEEIDLILDWRLLGYRNEEPYAEQGSKTRQDRFNKEVIEKSREFLATTFMDRLTDHLGDCDGVSISMDAHEPDAIILGYPASFSTEYIRPQVKLEIGPMAAWVPSSWHEIEPYASEAFPEIFNDSKCKVLVIDAERTFWEKATILHQQAHRTSGMPSRYSRHYYDVSRMSFSPTATKALSNKSLLDDVVSFKKKFYPCAWANYEEARPGSFKLLPPENLLKGLEKDYAKMREMIFGERPSFNEIVESLLALESRIND